MKNECGVCGYIYDDKINLVKFENLAEGWACPVCNAAKVYFKPLEEEKIEEKEETPIQTKPKINDDLSYLKGFERKNDEIEEYMDVIHEMAKTGNSVVEPMRSKIDTVSWKDILILGCQLAKRPLDEHAEVKTETVIGKNADKPLVIQNPVFVSHMSFGALSKEMKISLSKGSAEALTAMASGEGGIIPESMEAAYKYIFEYVPNKYSVTEENLKKADAIEIKIGQGVKPGMGGLLPGEKVTPEIAEIRGKEIGKDIVSPTNFEEIKGKENLKNMIDDLRIRSEGRPIGVKIAAGHIEDDLDVIIYSGADFVTIDGRPGGTGATKKFIKDAATIPTLFALSRARAHLDKMNSNLDLIITGGLRISSDFAKAIAMGADAVAIGTAAMIAAACQQYRVCDTGKCPVGCATQNEELRKRLNMDNAAIRTANFLNTVLYELKCFARITGNDDIHKLSVDNLCTTSSEISNYTSIKHV